MKMLSCFLVQGAATGGGVLSLLAPCWRHDRRASTACLSLMFVSLGLSLEGFLDFEFEFGGDGLQEVVQ